MYRSLNVPLELSQTIAKRDLLKPFKVYLSMKFISDGQIRLSDVDFQKVANLSGFKDQRTIKKHLQTCIDLNWIGTDGEWFFPRAFKRLRKQYDCKTRTSVEIGKENIPELLQFTLGAKLESRAKARQHARKKPGAKPQTVEPYTCLDRPEIGTPYGEYKVSCSLIGEWFGFSPSTATRLKQSAKKAGYLDYRHRYKKTGVLKANFATVAESISPERLLVNGSELLIRLTDTFIINRNNCHRYKFSRRPAL